MTEQETLAVIDEHGTLEVSVACGDSTVESVHVWDTDTGGDCYYVPEFQLSAAISQRDGLIAQTGNLLDALKKGAACDQRIALLAATIRVIRPAERAVSGDPVYRKEVG